MYADSLYWLNTGDICSSYCVLPMSMAALSSEAAQGLFESGYVIPATATVAASSNAANSEHIYAELGKLWAQTRRGLDALPPAQSHVPGEGRTIDEDLEDCVLAANTIIWASADPRPMIGTTQLYNRPSSIRAKMATAAKAHEAQRAADRAALEAHAHPPSIPLTPAKDDTALPKAAEQSGGLVAAILANIQGSENPKPAVAPDSRPKSGNESGGVLPSQVPPSLQNAAARLTTVGVTPLRKDAIGTAWLPVSCRSTTRSSSGCARR